MRKITKQSFFGGDKRQQSMRMDWWRTGGQCVWLKMLDPLFLDDNILKLSLLWALWNHVRSMSAWTARHWGQQSLLYRGRFFHLQSTTLRAWKHLVLPVGWDTSAISTWLDCSNFAASVSRSISWYSIGAQSVKMSQNAHSDMFTIVPSLIFVCIWTWNTPPSGHSKRKTKATGGSTGRSAKPGPRVWWPRDVSQLMK